MYHTERPKYHRLGSLFGGRVEKMMEIQNRHGMGCVKCAYLHSFGFLAEYYQPLNRPKRCRNWQHRLNGPFSCDSACRIMAREMPIPGLKQVNKLSNTV